MIGSAFANGSSEGQMVDGVNKSKVSYDTNFRGAVRFELSRWNSEARDKVQGKTSET